MSNATVAVPVLESLISVAGVEGSAPVTGLSFEGLVFEHSTWLLPSSGQGYIDNQVRQWLRSRWRFKHRCLMRPIPPPRLV